MPKIVQLTGSLLNSVLNSAARVLEGSTLTGAVTGSP